MLSKNSLNPADIVQLHKLYASNDPPPVDLIRIPQFLELLIDALFKPGSKINQEHKSKYIYLLAYASSVCDNWNFKRGTRKSLNKEELKGTTQAIEKVHGICSSSKGSTDLIVELNTMYQVRIHSKFSISKYADFLKSQNCLAVYSFPCGCRWRDSMG